MLAAVHHAEVVAHRVGEPFGSLVLAVAVTVIEVALIITLMSSGKGTDTLARDTAFAAVMITLNGIVGISILVGSVKHNLPRFNREGAGAALAVVTTLTTLTLVLPTFTISTPGAQFSTPQLVFVAVAALVLYGLFVLLQTGRHRDFFLPVTASGDPIEGEEHADPPSNRATFASAGLLLASLLAVVALAKAVSPAVEGAVEAAGIPHTFVGVVVALLVLLPEGLAATRSAARNRLQTSLNLGIGSAMASIGLTIPALAVALDLAARTPHPRARLGSDRAVRADRAGIDPHDRARAGDAPAGRRAPRALRRVHLPGDQPVAATSSRRWRRDG